MVQSIKDLSLDPQVPPNLGVVVHTCNPAAQEETDRLLELTATQDN